MPSKAFARRRRKRSPPRPAGAAAAAARGGTLLLALSACLAANNAARTGGHCFLASAFQPPVSASSTSSPGAAPRAGPGPASFRAIASSRDGVPNAIRSTATTTVPSPQFRCWHAPSNKKPPTALSAANNKSNDDDDDEKNAIGEISDDNGPLAKLAAPFRAAAAALFALLPRPVQDLVAALSAKFAAAVPTLRVAFASFVVGAVLGIGLILYPVVESIGNTPEPVMLFETILTDLDRGYVDKVDTNKLFETGISAMLRSLDPYTEFEGREEAAELTESVSGQYGGVGLVISGATPQQIRALPSAGTPDALEMKTDQPGGGAGRILPREALDDNLRPNDGGGGGGGSTNLDSPTNLETQPIVYDESVLDSPDDDDDTLAAKAEQRRAIKRARDNGIRVVNAFEGYAYDYGMRVGDRLMAIDGQRLADTSTVEDVRNMLRGVPGTFVDVSFVREGVDGETTVSIPRTVVQVSDVKLATLLGKAEDGIGYIQLSGFNANAGREVRNAILGLQHLAEDAPGGSQSLRGLVLDMRNNPGGLLNSAVDVASLLVPQGSDIVSAKGRGFPGVLYRSMEEPILSPSTKLTVLVNGQTASAAEIVSGAVQDLDVGVIVGADRTFGKGLVQSVDTLPFGSALKYTVAKYYTPSGRCIQSTNYVEGEGPNSGNGGKYRASKVADRDKKIYFTKHGREVQDGGGVAVDYKVEAQKSSALEYTLLRTSLFSDFASVWSRENQLTNNLDVVTDSTYQKFKQFVMERQKEGDIQLDAVYSGPIDNLKKALKDSGYKGTSKELEQLRASLIKDIERDFEKYKKEIKEDIGQNILARYLPESMLLEIGVKRDDQVQAAVALMRDDKSFDTLLGRVGDEKPNGDGRNAEVKDGLGTAIASNTDDIVEGDTHFHIVFLNGQGIPSRTKN